jgi:hypothetical protein
MKIQVTWNIRDGSSDTVETVVNPNDPHKDDEELQVTKARAAASARFTQKFGKTPPPNELSVHVIKD